MNNKGSAPAIVIFLVGIVAIGGVAWYYGKPTQFLSIRQNSEEQSSTSSASSSVTGSEKNASAPQGGDGITVLSPNNQEVWAVGSSHEIKWTSQFSPEDEIKIELVWYIQNGYYHPVIATVKNTGSFTWIVPAKIQASASEGDIVFSADPKYDFAIRVRRYSDGVVGFNSDTPQKDDSDARIAIVSKK
jgi:hypothetical protein